MGTSLQPTGAAEFSKPASVFHSKTGRQYRIFSNGGQRLIEESFAGQYSDTRTVAYSVGSGQHARSYLLERSGRLFQAPVTYFTRGGRWDMSPGYDTDDYVGFTRRVTANCLFCHTGRLNVLNKAGDVFKAPNAFAEAAIGCERCHGPGQTHISNPGQAIVNPRRLSPELRDQVCEQCHLFGAARVSQPRKSPADYRPGQRLGTFIAVYGWDGSAATEPSVTGHAQEMKQSVCRQKSENRLWCGSCHEIHVRSSRASIRTKCLSCHAPTACNRAPEPLNAAHRENDCVACHMPRRPVIESAHVTFTDHRIQRRPNSASDQHAVGLKLRSILPGELDDPVIASRNLGFAYAEVAGSTGNQEFFAKVVDLLRPLIGTNITDADFWQTLGEANLAIGEIAEAEKAFRSAVDVDPASSSAYYSLGYLLQRRNDLPAAIDAYRRAVAADPFKAEAFGNLAAAYFKLGKHEQAAAALKSALALEPGNLTWRASLQAQSPLSDRRR